MNSKRLLAIASLIEKEDKIVDIGCDHGYLDIYLVKNKLCKSAVASDISEKALSQAISNIKKCKLNKNITTIVSDGLKSIDLNNLNTIVVAGMGATTILDILDVDRVKNINKIILQSNNNLPKLREVMNKRNFKILKEIVVFEKNKYYTIIEYTPGFEKLSRIQKLIGIYNKENKGYYKYLLEKNNRIIATIPMYNVIKKIKLIHESYYLKKYLKNSL